MADNAPDEQVTLIAFQTGSKSQLHAQTILMAALDDFIARNPEVYAWWVAMDERYDRSDCDSAVFCTQGQQLMSQAALIEIGTSGPHNLRLVQPQ